MIQTHYVDGTLCPFIHCDHCGRKIEDYREAIAVFRFHAMTRTRRPLCATSTRPAIASRAIQGVNRNWQPLEEHLLALLYNTGLQSRQFKSLVRQTCP